jgi:hypothetical protein
MDNGKWYVSVDGVLQNSADLTSGTGFLHSNLTGELRPFILNASSGGTHTGMGNFGQDSTFGGLELAGGYSDTNGNGDFHSSVFSGYLALCTANLSIPEAIDPAKDNSPTDYFNTVLYTGSGSSPNSITGVGFQPDWVWIKNRTATISHAIFDSVRGVTASGATNKAIGSDRPDAEGNGNGGLSEFGVDGFTLVDGSSGSFPRSLVNDATTYVSWNWKAGGTAVLNEQGSINSNVSANTDAGVSIVTYTGTGTASTTIGHGLGVVPNIVVTKRRDSTGSWQLYSTAISTATLPEVNGRLHLEGTNAALFDSYTLEITSSTIEPTGLASTHTYWNALNGTYVMYCFAEIEGYSKFGSYTGNGDPDGTFVYTGFRPAFILYKKSSSTGNWIMDDNKTSTYNYDSNYLVANSPDPEGDTTTNTAGHMFDHLSNGFKMRNTNSDRNQSGATYIYMAFAMTPFKYSLGR